MSDGHEPQQGSQDTGTLCLQLTVVLSSMELGSWEMAQADEPAKGIEF